ncbi:MAG: replicative DNA helicase [Clostridia bacterium]|nr:replicative DNA helicase [Clostridia bacterium]
MEPFELDRAPYSKEAEMSLLGAILLDAGVLDEVLSLVSPDDFYEKENKQIFETLLLMQDAGLSIDYVTLMEQLKVAGYFEEDFTRRYILSLMDAVPTTKNAPAYAAIIHDKSVMRRLIEMSDEIRTHAALSDDEAKTLLEFAGQRIADLQNDKKGGSFVSIRDVMMEALMRLREMQSDPDAFLGMNVGFSELDRKLVGIQPSDLVFIAARPGMGKTSFALNIAQNVAHKTKKEVAIFSLEMSSAQLVERMISSEARVEAKRLKTGELQSDDWTKVTQAASALSESRIFINDASDITVGQMKSMCRRFKELGLVVIDYLQLMRSGAKPSENRVQEVSEISRSLKIMARELSVPVICLSQLSRAPEGRTDKRPQLSDLRESGSIEQDSDMVLMLFREDYYNKETEKQNVCEVIVTKNRHGETGKVELSWDGRYTRFDTIERKYEDEG